MAEVLPVQETPSTGQESVPERDSLLDKLDGLLEKYLVLLDEYQKARQQLSSQLSSGFLSLAQANFNASSNMRYGQDHYDERMKATRKASVSDDGSSTTFKVSFSAPAEEEQSTPSKETSESEKQASESTDLPRPKNRDPIRWYGILVPQALRKAQSEFTSAVETPVPQLCTILKQMRGLESEIGRTRKQLRKL